MNFEFDFHLLTVWSALSAAYFLASPALSDARPTAAAALCSRPSPCSSNKSLTRQGSADLAAR